MAKKPPAPLPEPPANLSEASKDLWRAVVTEPLSAGRAALITTALEAHDRAEEASAILRSEGLTTTTAVTGAVHVHPAVKIERDNRALFARLWLALGMERDDVVRW